MLLVVNTKAFLSVLKMCNILVHITKFTVGWLEDSWPQSLLIPKCYWLLQVSNFFLFLQIVFILKLNPKSFLPHWTVLLCLMVRVKNYTVLEPVFATQWIQCPDLLRPGFLNNFLQTWCCYHDWLRVNRGSYWGWNQYSKLCWSYTMG